METSNPFLKLIEKNDKKYCYLFGGFQEMFESDNFTKVKIKTFESYDAFRFLYDCLDERVFCNDKEFKKFIKNVSINSLTCIKFNNYNTKDNLEYLLDWISQNSEELKNQKETLIIELPKMEKKTIVFRKKFQKSFISINKQNKEFFISTNENYLIELYEKIQ